MSAHRYLMISKEMFAKTIHGNTYPMTLSQRWVAFGVNKVTSGWQWLADGEDGTFLGSLRKKASRVGHRLLERIPPSELFYRTIPNSLTTIQVVCLPISNPIILDALCSDLAFRPTFHKTRFIGACMLLPVTALVGALIPFPNIALAWVAFRAYCHYEALQGSRRLFEFLKNSPNAVQLQTDLPPKLMTSQSMALSSLITSRPSHYSTEYLRALQISFSLDPQALTLISQVNGSPPETGLLRV